MNQILAIPKKNSKNFFHILLVISLLVIFSSLFYLPYLAYNNEKRNKISNAIMQSYSLEKLYSLSNTINIEDKKLSPFVIGTLEIPSISLVQPVYSTINENLLKVSICKFYGPFPNEAGNMCIARA